MTRSDDLRDIDDSLRRVGRIGRSREAARHRADMSGVGLTNPAAGILAALHKHGPLRATALAAAADTEGPLVSRELRNLTALDFVVTAPDPHDGRGRVVSLTNEGRSAYERFRAAADAITAAAFSGWDDDDIEVLKALLRRVVSDFARPTPGTSARPDVPT